jgi:hypothetical protein
MPIFVNPPEPGSNAPFSAWEQYLGLDIPRMEGDSNPDRWVSGVSFRSAGCACPEGDELGAICAVDTWTSTQFDMDILDNDSNVEDHTFSAFEIKAKASCPSVGGWSQAKLDTYIAGRTGLVRSARLAAQVERAPYTSNATPHLASAAQDVSTADVTPVGALAAIEDALSHLLGSGTGMIHLTPGLATRLRGALVFDSSGARTVSGHKVVVDGGYLGVSPATDAVVAGEQWIYGSGPVAYKASSFETIGLGYETFDRARNVQYAYGHQFAVAIFEPCSVVAARVDVTP